MIKKNSSIHRWAGRLLLVWATCLFSTLSNAQEQGFLGKVTDSLSGDPIPAVSVTIKGTQVAVGTDADGNFQLPGDQPRATLVFSSLGYLTKEVNRSEEHTSELQSR